MCMQRDRERECICREIKREGIYVERERERERECVCVESRERESVFVCRQIERGVCI